MAITISEKAKTTRINLGNKRATRIAGLNCKVDVVYDSVKVEMMEDSIGNNDVVYPILTFEDGGLNISLFAYLNGYVDGDTFEETRTGGALAELLNAELDTLGNREIELGELCEVLNNAISTKKWKCTKSKIVKALSRKCEGYRFRYCEFNEVQ